jgi:hypothetical protein
MYKNYFKRPTSTRVCMDVILLHSDHSFINSHTFTVRLLDFLKILYTWLIHGKMECMKQRNVIFVCIKCIFFFIIANMNFVQYLTISRLFHTGSR